MVKYSLAQSAQKKGVLAELFGKVQWSNFIKSKNFFFQHKFVNDSTCYNKQIEMQTVSSSDKPSQTKKIKLEHIKLIAACIIVILSLIGEFIGGYFSHSLLIMIDAVHVFFHLISFLIGLVSICLTSLPASKRMSFGWYRTEILGAFVSVLLVWLIIGIVVYEAIMKLIHKSSEINADIMLITACVRVYINTLLCLVVKPHHTHEHNISQHVKDDTENGKKKKWWKKLIKGNHKNIILRIVFIHAVGDLMLSIGLVIAGYIIKFLPQWYIVDPISTLLFAIFVIISTLNILKDAILVLMESAPFNIDIEAVENDLKDIPNVIYVCKIYMWSLTTNKMAIAAHLTIEPNVDTQLILDEASQILKTKYGFSYVTIQFEEISHNSQ